MERVPYLGHELLRWQCGPSTFLALPEKGARLMNWSLELGDGSIRDVINWPELDYCPDLADIRGGAAVQFPFCGRCCHDGAPLSWKPSGSAQLSMPEDGFAARSNFKITRLDSKGFAALLVPDEAAQQAFPYDYEFEVTYRFDATRLACEFTLRNLDSRPVPWSAGIAFHLALPWNEGCSPEAHTLGIPASRTITQDHLCSGLLEVGPRLRYPVSVRAPELAALYHTGLSSNRISLADGSGEGGLSLSLGSAKTPHPMAGILTDTHVDKAALRLGAAMGPANAPAHLQGLHWVLPGLSQNFLVELSLD